MIARRHLAALASGVIFGLGLAVSGMTDRGRVLGFLDVAGAWDPTLLFVMGGAVAVTLVAFRFVLRLPRPVLDEVFHVPVKRHLDGPLVGGAALFGVGWGLAGYCPGPALASLVSAALNPVIFVLAMVAGSWVARATASRR